MICVDCHGRGRIKSHHPSDGPDQCQSCRGVGYITSEVTIPKSEYDALLADKARLDWMEAECSGMLMSCVSTVVQVNGNYYRENTAREAIDEAMKETLK